METLEMLIGEYFEALELKDQFTRTLDDIRSCFTPINYTT